MANITIRGVDKIDNRRLFREAARWVTDDILGSKINVNMLIRFGSMYDKECLAICEWVGDAARPRDFEITIRDNLSIRNKLKCMIHEIVHVKQYSRNELYDYQRGDSCKTRWHKQIIIRNDNCTLKRYMNYPWEKEAYGAEIPVLKKFLRTNKHIDLRNYTS